MRNIREFESILLRELGSRELITNEQRSALLREQTANKTPILEAIRIAGTVDEEVLLEFITSNFRSRKLEEGESITPTCTTVTDELFEKHRVMIDIIDDHNMKVFFTSPIFFTGWEEIEEELRRKSERIVVDYETFTAQAKVVDSGIKLRKELSLTAERELKKIPENLRAIQFADEVFQKSIRMNASDVHIEPQKNNFRIRMRLNGVLQVFGEYSSEFFPSFSSRVKLISNLNIAEKRDTQDGAIVYSFAKDEDEKIDVPFRVSVIPVVYGEKIVLRRLGGGDVTIMLSNLGMSQQMLALWRRVIKKPHGIILVSGPTGSGKSTTLQAAMNEIKSDEINITTVEDPVEAKIAGINQVQVDSFKVSFADALRSILRQDPDVIMIGEIRDKETAEIALRASLTGHLVYSTIHTNDAPSSVTRLVDMGIEPFLVSSSVVAVLAQRLMRVLCYHCKEEYETDAMEMKLLHINSPQKIYAHKGCFHCNNTGYITRSGVYELMVVDSIIQRMINEGKSDQMIKEYAVGTLGMSTIYQEAATKVLEGITTMDELKKVVAD
jgi:type IV pilus assembly protein PilB